MNRRVAGSGDRVPRRDVGDRVPRRDVGSGVVLVLGLIGTATCLALLVGLLGGAVLARHRAEAAADLAALAAASAVTSGCVRAAVVATADGAPLVSCRTLPDRSVLVEVLTDPGSGPPAGTWLGPARARARAGPVGGPAAPSP